jgi:hypothetical protein
MLHSMDDDLLVHAPAKLNLALSVGAPRPDGLHPLSSWMVTLGWGDSIYLRRRDPGSSSLFANVWAADAPHTPDLDWPLRSDLAWKAHAAIERAVGRQLPVRVRVEKRIPVGGGLGGGGQGDSAEAKGEQGSRGDGQADESGERHGDEFWFLTMRPGPKAGIVPKQAHFVPDSP